MAAITMPWQTAQTIMTSKTKTSPGKLPATYEAALEELETLVQKLESGQTPLDELLGSYQRGAALLTFCKDKLAAVEDQIRVLESGPQGMAAQPWEDDAA